MLIGVASGSAIGHTNVEQAKIGIPWLRERLEGNLSTVVNDKWLRGSKYFARRLAMIRRRLGMVRCPFE